MDFPLVAVYGTLKNERNGIIMVIKINRKKIAKITLLIISVIISPFAAGCIVRYAPDTAIMLMSAAASVDFGYSVSPVMNSGTMLLYTPEKKETEAEETTESKETETAAIPSPPTAEQLLISSNVAEIHEDLTVFAAYSGNVENDTYTGYIGTDFITLDGGGQVWNCTELDSETLLKETRIAPNINAEFFSAAPQVLIMHTHTHESYQIDERGYYDESYTCRSADPTQSVVAVGAAMAEALAENGICVIHDGTIHDEAYSGAYSRSEETVKRILNEYPSIKVVLDIHRDAVEEADGTRVSLISEIEEKSAAQVMIISAADDGTYNMPDYLDNFHFACALQRRLESDYAGITRPVLFQYCQYNQQLSTGSLLIEVGSHGNTLEQAVYSGRLVGKSLSALLRELAEGQ